MSYNGLREGLVWVLLLGVLQEHLRWAAVSVQRLSFLWD